MKHLFSVVCFLLSFNALGQLVVSDSLTVSHLVENVLVDASVLPSNIKFNGESGDAIMLQVSQFSTGSTATNLGLVEGLILATADTDVAIGPNSSASSSTFAFNGAYLDPDLIQIPGAQFLESSSVLEFDFVATGTELNFDYIFASEEYPEYANSSYNDVFGFFLSGPGITGPYLNNAANIALIPNTSTEVTINNLNNGTSNQGPCEYCEFYVSNGIGTTPETNTFIQYDGFTTVIRAKADLICGATYHMKLAIGNVGDNQYDSAVFIKNFNVQQSLELVESNNLPENLNVCFGETISIFSGIEAQDNIFVWKKDETVIPGNGPTITVGEGGRYSLSIFTAAGCKFAYDEILIGYRRELAIVDPPDINLCALWAPSYTFPTINQTNVILDALNPDEYLVGYYTNATDANLGSSSGLISPENLDNYTINAATGIIWVRVQEIGANLYGCSRIISFNINAYGIQTGDISYEKSLYCADLTVPQQVHSTASTGGSFTATPSGLQLDSVTGAILPSGSLGGDYEIVYNVPASGSCPAYSTLPALVTINATFANPPTVVSPVLYCQNETEVPLVATGTNLLWYSTSNGGVGSVTKPFPDSSQTGSKTYYVSQTVGGCESQRASIIVEVSPIPSSPIVVSPVDYCLGNSALPLSADGIDLVWYDSATATTGNVTAPTPDTSIEGNKTFYVSQTINGCESPRTGLTVRIKPPSNAPQVSSPITYCLNETAQPLSANGSNLLWYTDAVGGTGNSQPLSPDTSSLGSFDYYVSQTTNGCESARSVITVEIISTENAPDVISPLNYCQNETANPLTAIGTDLLWYSNSAGGIGTSVALTPQTSNPGITTFYVSQTLNGCESPRVPIVVNVFSPPIFSLPSDGILCTNWTSTVLKSFVLETGLDPLDHSFEWYDLNSGTNEIVDGAIESSLEVFEPGNYGVVAQDLITGCKSGMVTVNVTPAYPPTDFSFTTSNYFVDPTALAIEVLPVGTYEYQIDGLPFQDSPNFSNIPFGPHTVTVRDIYQCASLTKEIFFVNYPKFFTPNGDGYNDVWNIDDLSHLVNTKIHVFDRFGKLIKELFPSGTGWDGTYNSTDVPSTDYWFVIYYNENNQNKEFRSHFSLKR